MIMILNSTEGRLAADGRIALSGRLDTSVKGKIIRLISVMLVFMFQYDGLRNAAGVLARISGSL
jgi:limonene-1,2-epoxide hydrolase